MPEVKVKLDAIERQTGSYNGWFRQARVVFDTSVGTNASAGAHGLGVYLPAKATVTRGWLYVVTRLQGGGGTFALHCEDANNLITAADLSGHASGSVIPMIPQEGQNNIVRGTTIAARCEVTATVGSGGISAGKAVGVIEYFVAE